MAGCRYEGRSGGKGDVSTEPGNSDSFDFLLETDIQATREEWKGGSGEGWMEQGERLKLREGMRDLILEGSI